ncbi:MAG: ACT domain-containing protein [Desulfurococcaceae archaeon]
MIVEEIVKIDSKGRVTIPLTIRNMLDIREGMYVLLIADREKKEVRMTLIPTTSKLYRVLTRLEDRPGAMAEVATTLASMRIDVITSKCTVVRRGELGECEMIIDTSKSAAENVDAIKEALRKLEVVKSVDILEME